jgi:penicillin-binding protein 1C
MYKGKNLKYIALLWINKTITTLKGGWSKVQIWAKTHPYRAGALGVLLLIWLFCLPRPLFNAPYCAVLEDRDGALLGARIAQDGQWRFPVNDSLPEKYIKALLVFEDKMFFYHPGVNPVSTLRALQQNLSAGRTLSGGSTITMQVIRMARNNPPRTIPQKLVEMFMATRLELTYSKASILKLYAAHAPYGGNVVGIDAASWRYFGKKSNSITWSEAALLAILPNSPALLHPGRGRDILREKRNRLLQRLVDEGYMDEFELELAKSEPLPEKPLPLPQLAPHLLDRLQARAEAQKKPVAILQSTVKKEFQVRLGEILNRRQQLYKGNEVHNMAAIVIDVPTGEVLAYIGNVQGAGSDHNDQVDVLTAPRSTGSILKPYLYAWSLQSGDILPKSLLPDVPTQFGGYRPENYRETYDGTVSAEFALVRSLNVPFVHLLRDHGLEKFHHELKLLGLTTVTKSPAHYGLSLILGGAEANLSEVTNAYACMARRLGGFYRRNGRISTDDFRPLCLVPSSQPVKIDQHLVQESTGLSPSAIWHTFQAMLEVERPNSSGEWELFRSSRRIAWKTGTSFGFRDAWAVGTNARYAVGVWVGNADGEGRPGLIGVDFAAPVLFDIFNQLPGGDEWFDPPYDDMIQIPVCRQSGFRANEHCTADTVWVGKSGLNAAACTYHQLLHLDASGQYQVNSDCASPQEMQHVPWFILDPQAEYYYRSRHPEYVPPPLFRSDCAGAITETAKTPLRLIYPRENAQIFVPVDLDGQLSSVIFHATHREEGSELYWHLDNEFIGTTSTFHQFPLQPSVGKHTVTLVDKQGNRHVRHFEVLAKAQ